MVEVLGGKPGGVLAADVVLQSVLARVQVPAKLAPELDLRTVLFLIGIVRLMEHFLLKKINPNLSENRHDRVMKGQIGFLRKSCNQFITRFVID